MRLADRYVTGLFLSATGIFLLTFTVLFILIDFVTKAALFFSLTQVPVVPFLLRYYGLQLPLILLYVLPIVTLFGSVFTVLRLGKTNELVPLVTAGVSLRRISAPFVAAALLAGAALAFLDERVLPAVSEELAEMEEVVISKEMSWAVTAYHESGEHLYAFSYDHVRKEMRDVSIFRVAPPNRMVFTLKAKGAVWDAEGKYWTFHSGTFQEFDAEGRPITIQRPGARPEIVVKDFGEEGFTLPLLIGPQDLRRSFFLTASSLPYSEVREKVERYPHIPAFRLQLHLKFSFPLSPLVLLLLGLPFVVAVGTQGMMRGLALCLGVALLYYLSHFLAADLGQRGRVAPAAAAWAPTALFGGTGLVLFLRMRT